MIPLGLRAALRLLTVLPVPWDAREATLPPARAAIWFPLVGLAIGAVLFTLMLLPLPALPRAALCLCVWVLASNALHEDGVMDCADAALPPVSAERRAQIRKDPHVGAHGVTVSALLLIARFAALTAVSAPVLLLAPVAGRWCMALTLAHLRPHASSSLGAVAATRSGALVASATGIAIVAAVTFWQRETRLPLAVAAGLLAGLLVGHWLTARLDGASGDVHGAAGVITETVVLYAAL